MRLPEWQSKTRQGRAGVVKQNEKKPDRVQRHRSSDKQSGWTTTVNLTIESQHTDAARVLTRQVEKSNLVETRWREEEE